MQNASLAFTCVRHFNYSFIVAPDFVTIATSDELKMFGYFSAFFPLDYRKRYRMNFFAQVIARRTRRV
jgi:hypothetical protein